MKQDRVGERGFLTFFVSGVFLPVAPYKYMGGYEGKVIKNRRKLHLFLELWCEMIGGDCNVMR